MASTVRPSRLAFLLGAALAVPLAAAVPAQLAVHHAFGAGSSSGAGCAVAGLGDLDGDGYGEFAYSDTPTTVVVVSGASGVVLFPIAQGGFDEIGFGNALAPAGDLDGDGLTDLLIGADLADGNGADSGLVRVVSGADGSTLLDIDGPAAGVRMGFRVAGVGDADGDGVPDLLASGARLSTSPGDGLVVLYSGADGSVLQSWPGSGPLLYGHAIAGIGDADGDGLADVVIGSVNEGVARVHSGADGSLLHTLPGTPEDVASAGDHDGDGRGDVLVIMSQWFDGFVRVYSGATGAPLADIGVGHFPDNVIHSVTSPGDVDGDGVPDYAFARQGYHEANDFSAVYAGATGASLYNFATFEAHTARTVRPVGDVDGDGVPDYSSAAFSQFWVVSGAPSSFKSFFATAGSGKLTATGPLVADTDTSFLGKSFPADRPLFLVAGFSLLNMPFQGGVLVPSPDVILGPVSTSAQGHAVLSGRWPPGIAPGTTLWFQAWVKAGPGAFVASNALLATAH